MELIFLLWIFAQVSLSCGEKFSAAMTSTEACKSSPVPEKKYKNICWNSTLRDETFAEKYCSNKGQLCKHAIQTNERFLQCYNPEA